MILAILVLIYIGNMKYETGYSEEKNSAEDLYFHYFDYYLYIAVTEDYQR